MNRYHLLTLLLILSPLAAPAGEKAILGLDPGLRTGVKVAIVMDASRIQQYR